MSPRGKQGSAQVVCQLHTDAEVASQVLRESTVVCVKRLSNRGLEFKGVATLIRGPAVWIELGDPTAPRATELGCRPEPPIEDSRLTWDAVRTTVRWQQVHELEYGAPVLDRGHKVGYVVGVAPDEDQDEVVVELAYFDRQPVSCRYARARAEYYIQRVATQRLEVQGAQTVLQGPAVLVAPGDPQGEPTFEFTGRPEVPPEPLPSWDSLRTVVTWKHLYDMQPGAPVLSGGRRVGVVDRIERESDRWNVTLAFHARRSEAWPEVREGANYYIGRFDSQRLKLQWPDTALRGPLVYVVPGDPEGAVRGSFEGRPESPPKPAVAWNSVARLRPLEARPRPAAR